MKALDKLAEQKKEYDSKLDEQKESYERLIAAKDDDISKRLFAPCGFSKAH